MFKTSATLVFVLASPVAAQQFSLPAGCTGYMTIQSTSCSVSHYFTCESDPAGYQRRASLDEEGLSYVGMISDDAEWAESFHMRSGHSEQLAQSADPMSITELMEQSVDTWDFTTDSREIGPSRYVGMDRLTGETVEIDGITLLRTEFSITAYDGVGNEVWRSEGREYVMPERNMFLGGISTVTTEGDKFPTDNTPIEFIFPGEAGYLSVNPKYGCGLEMS